MLENRRRTGYLLAAVVLGHVILISAQVNTQSGVRVLEAVTFGVFAEIQRGAALMIGSTRQVWDGYLWLRGLRAENDRLRERVSALEVRVQEQRALARRAERLQQLLDLRDRLPQRTLAADVIAGDATSWFRTVTIDKGSTDGLRPNMAVLAATGVVGRIVDFPARKAALVQLLIDRNAGAGALIERTRAGGVVFGGETDRALRMEYVSNLADVRVGDLVVTSGLDGIYPKGYVIGRVESVERGVDLYKTIRVRPSVDFSALEEVLVVLDPQVPAPSPAEGTP